jgi:bifunctional UDP-N-acetylglucosamine pyrophosphorylase/glucosamine-1-phosphate N-acetyltransferase
MKTACVILAAGQGKRMKSSLPKVLHKICGMPMLQGVIDTAKGLNPDKIVVVAGKHVDMFRKEIADPDVRFVLQKEPKGTGDALKSALPALKGFRGQIIVLNGDTPLIRPATIRKFLGLHHKMKRDVSVLSFEASDPAGYGRIVRDKTGRFIAIIEEKDADSVQKGIREVNSGVYALNQNALSLIHGISMNRLKREYYLTDIVALAMKRGFAASAFEIGLEEEFMGVNTREELLQASEIMRRGIVRELMTKGVNIIDPGSVFIHPHASVGSDTTIYPNVLIEGRTTIGRGVTIYPNVRVSRSMIGNGSVILDSTVIEDSVIREGASVGPFAHLRPGADVGACAKIGNFVELKKTVVGKGAKASHLSYLGDAKIGRDVNIGAGTITCNYDGKSKHRTVIEEGVFIGSDTQLVAPVRIGKGAYLGAGSTITKDVPPGALAVSRTEQRNIKDWATRRKAKNIVKGKSAKGLMSGSLKSSKSREDEE